MKKTDKKNNRLFNFKKIIKKTVELDDNNIHEVVVERDSGFNIVEVIVIILVSILFGTVVGCVLSSSRSFGVEVSDEVQEIITTYESIVSNYYEEIDEKELLDSAVSGMISELDDPYSIFMDSDNTEVFNKTVEGSFVGIGVSVEWVDNSFRIVEILDNSPAEKAKLQVNDYLIKISGDDVLGLTLDELSDKIRGKVGSKVDITVRRGDEEITVNIKREIVDISSVYSKVVSDDVGYIFIESFASNTSKQFIEQLEELENKKISSLIIDVRDNPGGKLSQVNNILDLFFDKKTVLYQIKTKDKVDNVYAKKANKRKYPVIVLVNHGSASASEILASCFQDNYQDAVIVGEVTYGKGTIQKAIELSSGSSIKYTTQKWLTSKGEWLNGNGVIPDQLIAQSSEGDGNFNADDIQLKRAIEFLKK